MLAKVVATSASSESGSPLRRSYVSSDASVSIPVRSRSSSARASPTLALCRCPKASALADVGHLGALPDRTLGRDHEGVVARVRGVVGLEQGGQRVEVVGHLRDDAARRGHVCRVQRREPGVPPEDPEDADPLVAPERGALPVDRLLGARDRGREADAVLGPLHIVVHRLRDGDERHAGVHQHLRIRQRVVAADGHQHVDAEGGDVVEDVRRQVVEIVADRVARALLLVHPRRQPGRAHLARVGSRCVQDGATGPLDRPGVDPVERTEVVLGRRIARPQVGETLPAAADAEGRVPDLGGAVDHALDDGVEARDVASAGQDGDAFWFGHGGRHATAPGRWRMVAVGHRAVGWRDGGPHAVC